KIRRNSATVVTHGDLDARVFSPQLHLDPSTVGAELDRVRQKITHDLLKSRGVTRNESCAVIERSVNGDVLGGDLWLHRIEGGFADFDGIDGRYLELEFS